MVNNQKAIEQMSKEADNLIRTKSEASHSSGIRVFVYGTLKKGHHNHKIIGRHLGKESVFLGRCALNGPFTMVDLGYFPGVIYTPTDTTVKNMIYGEVYRINQEILTHLDVLEGNGQFYTRERVETPWKKAWCYFIPRNYMPVNRSGAIITSGTWRPSEEESAYIASLNANAK
jgi:gamma-glutamylaminecyclotransferase